jgi:biopolymer transport protein TolR
MSMTPGSRGVLSSEMNVTPFIDVLLVLFVIFMVMPHHRGEKADIPMPDQHQPQPKIDENVVIELRDSGDGQAPNLAINRHSVAWGALENKLREIYASRGDKVAFVKGDPEVEFRYVADTLDVAHRAGVDRIGLMGAKE